MNIQHNHGDAIGFDKGAIDQRHGTPVTSAGLTKLETGGWINDFMSASHHGQQQNAVFEQVWQQRQQPGPGRWADSFLQHEPAQNWANSFAMEQRRPSRWVDNFVEEEKSFDNIYNEYALF